MFLIFKKKYFYLVLLVFFVATIAYSSDILRKHCFTLNRAAWYDFTMKRDLICVMLAYPEYVVDLEKRNDKVYLITKNGNKIVYDDKVKKNDNEKLYNPDIQDALEKSYIFNEIDKVPVGNDCGRNRVYELLGNVYGKSSSEIKKNLVLVDFGYHKFLFNKNNGAARALRNADSQIKDKLKIDKGIYAYVYPSSGTYNDRLIAGTNRLSPHAYGIAIDLKSHKNDYWKWSLKKDADSRIAKYPKSLVKIFENNNFVWGGKWEHFDILHFEYRPEIIIKSKYFSKATLLKTKWYEPLPYNNVNVRNLVMLIDEKLK